MASTTDRLKKAERTSEVAFGIINAEASARDAKTAKLRKLREALDGSDATPDDAVKPAPAKKKRARSTRKVGL